MAWKCGNGLMNEGSNRFPSFRHLSGSDVPSMEKGRPGERKIEPGEMPRFR
jgi:hypothetical protein